MDADHDGVANGVEDLNGTDMNEPGEKFEPVNRLVGVTPGIPTSTRVSFDMDLGPLRRLVIQGSSDLTVWEDLGTILGDGLPFSFNNDNPSTHRFMRIQTHY
jgi:hypothetical protein